MNKKTVVALAGTYPANTAEKLRRQLPENSFELLVIDTQEAYERMTEAEIIILRIFKGPERIMENNPGLKMIMRWGAGYDSVDVEAASRRGILVTNTPGANAGAVSELAVLMMLAVGRRLMCHQDCLHRGIWSNSEFLNASFTLNNRTVGIIGAGNIGRQVALKARAFGANTIYYDVFRLSPEQEKELALTYALLDELIEKADVISVHVPLTDDNYHLIDAGRIASMKKGAIVINTARGGLVDEAALIEAVNSGRLAGAGLDVVEKEPLSPEDPLLLNPNIIVTPHIGGGTADLGEFIIPMLIRDIMDYISGNDVIHAVNKLCVTENG